MKKLLAFFLFFIFPIFLHAAPSLIPLPSQMSLQEGQFTIGPDFSVVTSGPQEPRVDKAVVRFKERLAKRTGLTFPESSIAGDKSGLVIIYKTKGLPVQSVREDESYKLTVGPHEIRLTAPNPLGVLHGLETLLQLVGTKDTAIPCVTIEDKPRFAWRGLLLDACRHWMPVEVVKRNLDGMAEAKMNVLHLHLSENQGFRVESLKYPLLQEKGSEGNYYTQDQVRDIVDYARDRGIRVVPEFDMPGHSTAWLVGYPELAAAPGPLPQAPQGAGQALGVPGQGTKSQTGPGPFEVDHKYGVLDGCMDPTKESVIQFLDGFIGEMADLFPDEYFHIGGDEVNGKWWNENPAIQSFMYAHNFQTNLDLQTYFNSRLSKILTSHHKKMEGWDEILDPNLPKTIVVQSWRGPDSLVASVKKGYDTILSSGYYLDLAQPASDHYKVDPIPSDGVTLTPAETSHILGGEACMWSELVDQKTVDSRIWPRVLAIAERLWSPASTTDLVSFYDRMEVENHRLEELGLIHLSYPKTLIEEMVGKEEAPALELLAGTLEPLKFYQRHKMRNYTTQTPLDRLTDALAPESLVAHYLPVTIDGYLRKAPAFGNAADLAESLTRYRDNDKSLGPVLLKSDHTVEVAILSRDLSETAQVGLEAIGYLKSGKNAPATWLEKTTKILDKAQEPHVDLQLAVVPPIRKLALAAASQDKLKDMQVEDWNKSLDDQVDKATPKPKKW